MWAYERCVCCLGDVVALAFLVGELKLKEGLSLPFSMFGCWKLYFIHSQFQDIVVRLSFSNFYKN